jgi:crossover junction endodeoxyribonuclease RusA
MTPLRLIDHPSYLICLGYIMDCEGLTTHDVAKLTGLGYRTVCALKDNQYKRIGLDTLAALTDGLNVPLDSLLRKSVPERGASITINLGWPEPRLSPNRRPDNAKFYRAMKAEARNIGFILTKQKLAGEPSPFKAGVSIRVAPYVAPPNAHRRDEDNFIAGLKHYMDGIAKALEVDDAQFRWERIRWLEPVKGGALAILLEEVL